ncbi:MAG: fructose-6-phosphate aldolase [Clostridiales bacterium]
MKLFIDSANVREIKEIWSMGILAGVTTNPTLIAKEGVNIEKRLQEILSVTEGIPVNGEAMGREAAELVAHGKKLAAIDQRIVIKVPMTAEGLKAIREMKAEGIRTNATLIFTAAQCLAAARAGASYISPFLGRLEDNSRSYISLLEECRQIWQSHGLTTEIIAASIRRPEQVAEAAARACHIATIPYPVLLNMLLDPLTEAGIKRFEEDWAALGSV